MMTDKQLTVLKAMTNSLNPIMVPLNACNDKLIELAQLDEESIAENELLKEFAHCLNGIAINIQTAKQIAVVLHKIATGQVN